MDATDNAAEDIFLVVWTMLLAAGMASTPWLLGFLAEARPTLNLWACAGLAAALAALSLRRTTDRGESGLALVGLWTCAAPWLLGFRHAPLPLLAHLGFGFALIVAALAGLWRLRTMSRADPT
ncbi:MULTISPECIES: SPW repeat domain-containing protein [Methylobacterium]|uniref:SPW repeat domain-containing protein n=1 Tax=Methylobacterium TaxID=407 RepID=UPI0013ED1727|nr:hypothetical protein [Methylobacterium sp. DB0501]NGM34982.1 hypothetical protein [Methylobacterium sp. DB0501]